MRPAWTSKRFMQAALLFISAFSFVAVVSYDFWPSFASKPPGALIPECFNDVAWPAGSLLVDERALRQLARGDCPVTDTFLIAVPGSDDGFEDIELGDEDGTTILVGRNGSIQIRKIPMLAHNDTDFVVFLTPTGKKAMQRFLVNSSGLLNIPLDIPKFLQLWEEANFIDCLGIDMNRTESKRTIALEDISKLAELRDFLIARFGIHPSLFDGTLLGWYRECSIIPHTHDFDMAALSEEYVHGMAEVVDNSSQFRVSRIHGQPIDSLEFTFVPLPHGPPIDLFFLYRTHNASYTPGLDSPTGTKIRWEYPWRIDRFCTGELLGHLFRVPCEVERVLETQYGPNWREDHPTYRWGWSTSSRNNRVVGKFSPEEMKEMRLG